MISYTPIENLKKTFGKMIAAFVEAGGLLPSQITAMMLGTNYFDFFERDGQEAVKEYAEKSFSRMFFEIYHSELSSPVSDNVGPFYWAGIQYMNLFLNYQIPLKQLFLLCPLEKMISYFPVYHEMNEASLCKRVIESDLTQSILRALRKSRSLSVRQLSLLTGIKESSILYYEQNNENLFRGNNENIRILRHALGVDSAFFASKSSFVPIAEFLLNDETFKNELKQNACALFSIKDADSAQLSLHIIPILKTQKKQIAIDNRIFETLYRQLVEKRTDKTYERPLLF